MARAQKIVLLPELVETEPGPWTVTEVDIRQSAVDLQNRRARVPRPYTEAQKLARFHELGHVKWTPRDWKTALQEIGALAAEMHDTIDVSTAFRITKMLEENRIDWLMWNKKRIDLRPAREVLDWSLMPEPKDPLEALEWVLQLAWTVWASLGLKKIPDSPPSREVDYATRVYFDRCWDMVAAHNSTLPMAVVQGCLAIYADPTNERRNRVATELAAFFPRIEEEKKPPPEKKEEKEKQVEAERLEEERERKLEEEETGLTSEYVSKGEWVVHDHTLSVRRPTTRIVRRDTAHPFGIRLTHPQRYMLDKAIFGRRSVTEGGILIDGSSSMRWENKDLVEMVNKLPAVTVGVYAGYNASVEIKGKLQRIRAKLCILARRGRFCKFTGYEPGWDGGNQIDIEALQLLATWPKPRLWISDGVVCEGPNSGPHPDDKFNTTDYMRMFGAIVAKVDRLMQRHEILRVPDMATMMALLQRRRVTLYATCCNHENLAKINGERYRNYQFPASMKERPVQFQL